MSVLDPDLAAFALAHGIGAGDVAKALEEVLAFVAEQEPTATPAEKRALAKGVILGLGVVAASAAKKAG